MVRVALSPLGVFFGESAILVGGWELGVEKHRHAL